MAYTCKSCGAVANEPGHLCNPCGDEKNCSFCGSPSVDQTHICKDKLAALSEILDQTGVKMEEVCYVGDGKYDIPIMKIVKYAACPNNAITEVKELSTLTLKCNGGDGCIWELMEWIREENYNG